MNKGVAKTTKSVWTMKVSKKLKSNMTGSSENACIQNIKDSIKIEAKKICQGQTSIKSMKWIRTTVIDNRIIPERKVLDCFLFIPVILNDSLDKQHII